jgi:hypothetical protein
MEVSNNRLFFTTRCALILKGVLVEFVFTYAQWQNFLVSGREATTVQFEYGASRTTSVWKP